MVIEGMVLRKNMTEMPAHVVCIVQFVINNLKKLLLLAPLAYLYHTIGIFFHNIECMEELIETKGMLEEAVPHHMFKMNSSSSFT